MMRRQRRAARFVARDRAVWAAVSRNPNATIREIGAACGISPWAARRALVVLERLGYIRATPGAARGRSVLVPMV